MARTEARARLAASTWQLRIGRFVEEFSGSSWPNYLILAGICLVGAWLRLTALDRQSLWFDEADVVVRAQRDLRTVLGTFIQAGENGPLYNLLLHIWIGVFGASETSVRMPSAIAGVASIPLMYVVGARTVGRRVGLFAAGLLAISPYHVWYSQEAKMYALVVLLTLASTALFIEALGRNERRWWVAYVLATSVAFYLHVTTVLIFASQSVYFLLTWRSWPGRRRAWIYAVAALTLPYVPIALWAARVVLGFANTWQPKVTLPEMIKITATKFAVNRADLVTEARGTRLFEGLALIGAIGGGLLGWSDRPRDFPWTRRWVLLFTVLTVLSLLGFYVVTLRQPLYNDRYLIMVLPAFLLLAAIGLRGIELRAWPLAPFLMAALIAYAWVPLRDVNRSSLSQKEDWRPAYGYVLHHAEPDDLILVHPGYLITTYEYYAQQIAGLATIKASTIPSFRVEGFDAHQMALWVRRDAPGQRVWLVMSPDRVGPEDPNAALETWLKRGGEPEFPQRLNGIVIALYHLPPPELDPS